MLLFATAGAYADIELISSKQGETVPVVTEAQRAFLVLSPAEKREKFADKNYHRKEMGMPAEVVEGVTRKPWWPKTTRLEWKAVDGVDAYDERFFDALPRELGKRYSAATTRESAEAFARAAGITDAEIENFRRLMLEP